MFYVSVKGFGGMHILVFVSQDSSDRWWRSLQAQKGTNKNAPKDQWDMVRMSAQCYWIEGYAAWMFHQQSLSSPEKGFIIQDIFFMDSAAPSALQTIPPPTRIDYLNGKTYSIRLSGHTDFFWDIQKFSTDTTHKKPNICVSTTRVGSAKFLIQRATSLPYRCEPGEDILIGSDEVAMIAIVSGKVGSPIALDGAYFQPDRSKDIFKFKF